MEQNRIEATNGAGLAGEKKLGHPQVPQLPLFICLIGGDAWAIVRWKRIRHSSHLGLASNCAQRGAKFCDFWLPVDHVFVLRSIMFGCSSTNNEVDALSCYSSASYAEMLGRLCGGSASGTAPCFVWPLTALRAFSRTTICGLLYNMVCSSIWIEVPYIRPGWAESLCAPSKRTNSVLLSCFEGSSLTMP
jgi:hypothetical protein